jgi:atypical dual specificity phosphatase
MIPNISPEPITNDSKKPERVPEKKTLKIVTVPPKTEIIDGKFRRDMAQWLGLPRFGTFIEVDDFLALPLKVPLDPQYDRNLYPEERFYWEDVFDFANKAGKPIKYIVDCTNSNTYYKHEKLPSTVVYHHCKIPGRKMPRVEDVEDAFRVFDKARAEKAGVAVHCTHGRNRTGYIVILYLITCLKLDPEAAIQVFEFARRSNVECPKYLNALRATPTSKIPDQVEVMIQEVEEKKQM